MQPPARYTARETKESILFTLPLGVFIVLLILVPILGTCVTSTFQDIPYLERKFIFLKNYQELFRDPGFWQALGFTLLFIMISVPLELVLGFVFALVLHLALPLQSLLRCCVLIPWAVPAVISARIWELIYNYTYGLANIVCMKLGIADIPLNWLGTGTGAFAAVVIADVWKTTPFIAIILLAGLHAIPRELSAQAKVDRANFFQIFFTITLPLLTPVILVALLFRTIDALRIFDLIYVLSHGGPGGATTSLSFYSYKYFLSGDFGYGSAVSVVLFLISFFLSVLYVKSGRFLRYVL